MTQHGMAVARDDLACVQRLPGEFFQLGAAGAAAKHGLQVQ